jgi:methyltransferase
MTGAAPVPAATATALAVFLVALLAQRLGELWLSRRNLARLAARGAVESHASRLWMFVALHSAFPVALVAEVIAGARPPAAWPLWLGVWLVAQALRAASIHTLGERWNARIVTVPGAAPVTGGIYRWLAHPNYVAVALEFVSASLMFGAWRTAGAFSALNALAMAVRVPAEERALLEAQKKDPAPRSGAGSVKPGSTT